MVGDLIEVVDLVVAIMEEAMAMATLDVVEVMAMMPSDYHLSL